MNTGDLLPVQFSVVKFVPDQVRDEPVNVGVVARVDNRLVLRTTPQFRRIRQEAGVSDTTTLEIGLTFLRSTLDREPNLALVDLVNVASGGILRLTEVLAGLTEEPWEFIEELYDRYVDDHATSRTTTATTRRTIRNDLRRALAVRGADSERFAISKRRFIGATGKHDFDFGFENGKLTLLRGISLQTDESYALRDARELSFAAQDSYRRQDNLGLELEVVAVVAPATEPSNAYDEALGLVKSNVNRVALLDSPQMGEELDHVLHSDGVRPLSANLLVDPVTTR